MNRYDLDFKNIFQLIGIEQFDKDYLFNSCNKEVNSAKLAIASNRSVILMELKFVETNIKLLVDPSISIEEKKKILEEIKTHRDKIASISFKGKDEIISNIDNCIESIDNSLEHDNETIRMVHNFSHILLKMEDGVIESARSQRKDIEEYFQKLSSVSNAEEILLWHLIQLKSAQIIRKSEGKKHLLQEKVLENVEIATVIKNMFPTVEELDKYIKSEFKVIQYVDIDKADMHKYAYKPKKTISSVNSSLSHQKYTGTKVNDEQFRVKRNPYVYAVQIESEPTRIFQKETESKADNDQYIEAYEFGKFAYGMFIKPDGMPAYQSQAYQLVGIIRENEQKELQSYYGIMNINRRVKPEFYLDVAFSNMVLRNAKNNNFGFIGNPTPYRGDDPYNLGGVLTYEGIGDTDLIAALSYALDNPGKSNIKSIQDLHDAYEYISNSLKERIKMLSEKKQPDISQDIASQDEIR